MLWRIPADTRATRIGIMLSHFDGSTAARAPPPGPGSIPIFRRGRLVKTGCANCANPPIVTPVARSGCPPRQSRLHDDGDAPRHRAFEQRAHRLGRLVQPEGAVDMRPAKSRLAP